MNKFTTLAVVIPLAALVSACDDGSDGVAGTDGSEGPLPQLIVVDYETLAACPT